MQGPGPRSPSLGQEAAPCRSGKQRPGGRQRADARGWGHPVGSSSVLWRGPSKRGVPAPSPAHIGGAQGQSLTESQAPPPSRHLRPHHWPAWESQLCPAPRQLLCAFNAVRQSHAGGRAGGGGLGCSRSAGGGRGGHAQTHVSLPRAEGGTPTTTTTAAQCRPPPPGPCSRPDNLRRRRGLWLPGGPVAQVEANVEPVSTGTAGAGRPRRPQEVGRGHHLPTKRPSEPSMGTQPGPSHGQIWGVGSRGTARGPQHPAGWPAVLHGIRGAQKRKYDSAPRN